MTSEEVEAEWEKTRDIDNPLNPWVQVYKGELKLEEGAHFHDRPPLDIVIGEFCPQEDAAAAREIPVPIPKVIMVTTIWILYIFKMLNI